MLHARATSDARNRPKTTLGARRRHARRPWAEHSHADLARNRFAPHPTTPVPIKRSRRDAPESVRVAHGLEELLAQGPAKGRAKGQQRGGANGAGQGGNNAAAQSGLTRVRGAECAQGIMRALRDGLRGHARAILATSLLHILTHLYLVDDRRQHGHHGGMSRRGNPPLSTPLGVLIERAQTTCESGRACGSDSHSVSVVGRCDARGSKRQHAHMADSASG